MTVNLKKIDTKNNQADEGFTLVEVVIAMVIFLIAVMGVFATFAYAVNYNAGNNSRARALTVLQQEIELLRSAKFTPTITDSTLVGGNHPNKIITTSDNYSYVITKKVDNDPYTPEIQSETNVPKPTIKEITLIVTLNSPTPGWQTAVPSTVVMRRVRAN